MNPARIELLALIAVALAVFLIVDHRFGKGRRPKAAHGQSAATSSGCASAGRSAAG